MDIGLDTLRKIGFNLTEALLLGYMIFTIYGLNSEVVELRKNQKNVLLQSVLVFQEIEDRLNGLEPKDANGRTPAAPLRELDRLKDLQLNVAGVRAEENERSNRLPATAPESAKTKKDKSQEQ